MRLGPPFSRSHFGAFLIGTRRYTVDCTARMKKGRRDLVYAVYAGICRMAAGGTTAKEELKTNMT